MLLTIEYRRGINFQHMQHGGSTSNWSIERGKNNWIPVHMIETINKIENSKINPSNLRGNPEELEKLECLLRKEKVLKISKEPFSEKPRRWGRR